MELKPEEKEVLDQKTDEAIKELKLSSKYKRMLKKVKERMSIKPFEHVRKIEEGTDKVKELVNNSIKGLQRSKIIEVLKFNQKKATRILNYLVDKRLIEKKTEFKITKYFKVKE